MIKEMSCALMGLIAPFAYTKIIFAINIKILIFESLPDTTVAFGNISILVSGVFEDRIRDSL